MKTPYYITNDLAVDARFRRELASTNLGDRPDDAVWLYAAPEIGAKHPSAIIYIATNGDPIYVGALGSDEWHHVTEDTDDEGEPVWMTGLKWFGFDGDTEGDAREFVESLMADVGMIE